LNRKRRMRASSAGLIPLLALLTASAAIAVGALPEPESRAPAPTAGVPAAAGDPSPLRIVYRIFFNGEDALEEGRIVLDATGGAARVRTEPPGPLRPGAPREAGYVDYFKGIAWQSAELKDGSRCAVESAFATLPALEPDAGTDTILGFPCRQSTAVLRSNRLEVWSTTLAGVRGTPSPNLIVPDGLILRIVRNGNHEIVADHVVPGSAADAALPSDWGDRVDAAAYRARVAASWVTEVPVFDREPIRYEPGLPRPRIPSSLPAASGGSNGDGERGEIERLGPVGPVYRCAAGTVILRRVRLPQEADAAIFAELTQYSAGDAYDRTGSIFLLPASGDSGRRGPDGGAAVSFLDALRDSVGVLPQTIGRDGRAYQGIAAAGGYRPPLELIRFITPFGIRQYNEQVTVRGLAWEDSARYTVDLSELAPALRGEVWIGAFIGNYDAGGHVVSLKLRYHPNRKEAAAADAEAPRVWIEPLFNTANVLEMAGQEYGRIFAQDSLTVEFDLPAGLARCTLRYLTTGHGGWGGGDEFNPKVNTILLDGRVVASFAPWRSDCGAYRRWNPASGNFWNGLSSSDFSRSGWCPGTAVSPVLVPLTDLTPGRHRLQVAIPLGVPEGPSFSAWNVSGALVGEY